MSNKRWNNQHGANDKSGGGHKEGSRGSKPSSGSNKTINWPGLPGPTQPRARNAGTPKTGHKGSFYVQSKGL